MRLPARGNINGGIGDVAMEEVGKQWDKIEEGCREQR